MPLNRPAESAGGQSETGWGMGAEAETRLLTAVIGDRFLVRVGTTSGVPPASCDCVVC